MAILGHQLNTLVSCILDSQYSCIIHLTVLFNSLYGTERPDYVTEVI